MADKTFRLEIVTPERMVIADDTVTSVVAPGVEGYLGILANHAPLLVELKIGEVSIERTDGPEQMVAISGGFMEVGGNKALMLADTAELAEEIDVTRAKDAKLRAQDRLHKRAEAEIDASRAEAALMRAMNRLHVAEHMR